MLVLDFDGTLTDVEQEGEPFREAYAGYVARLLGCPQASVAEDMDRITREALASDPALFGWVYGPDNWIMAPAQVDPYLRANAAARRLLAKRRVFTDSSYITRFLDIVYEQAYPKTLIVPKDGARDLLYAIWTRNFLVAIVSNSRTDGVANKLDHFLSADPYAREWCKSKLFGDARKMDPSEYRHTDPSGAWIKDPDLIADWSTDLPTKHLFPGFPRKTVIKRPSYLARLNWLLSFNARVHGPTRLPWRKVLVVGDIFELDLALPLMLGCHVGFVVNEHSPPWEVAFVESHERGRLITDLSQILPYYDEIQAAASVAV